MDRISMLEERKSRIFKAVSLERPDRVPVVLEYNGFAAFTTGTSMADFVSTPAMATRAMIEAYGSIGGGDAVNYGSFFSQDAIFRPMPGSKTSGPWLTPPWIHNSKLSRATETDKMVGTKVGTPMNGTKLSLFSTITVAVWYDFHFVYGSGDVGSVAGGLDRLAMQSQRDRRWVSNGS